MNTWKIFI